MSALERLAEELGDEYVGGSVGMHMTCTEADALAAVIALADERAATKFLIGHSMHDEALELDVHLWFEGDARGMGRANREALALEYVKGLAS